MAEKNFDNCFVCSKTNPIGLHMEITDGEGWSKGTWEVTENYVGYENMLHGGIMSTILDDLMAHAISYLDEDIVTVHMDIDYKAPAFIGDVLECEANLVERGNGRSIKLAGRIKKGDILVAEAKGVMVILK